MAEQGCIQKFCQGGANLGYGKKRGAEADNSIVQGLGRVLHPTLAMLAC